MKQEPVSVSDTRKIEQSIMAFLIAMFRFAVQCLKDLHSEQRQKNEQYDMS